VLNEIKLNKKSIQILESNHTDSKIFARIWQHQLWHRRYSHRKRCVLGGYRKWTN